MAVPEAVRRGGSLLLRALTVGGLATAAWLVCAGVAAAGEDHSVETAKTLDTVNVAHGEQQPATVELLAGALTHPPLRLPVSVFDQPRLELVLHPFGGPPVAVDRPLAYPTDEQAAYSYDGYYSDDTGYTYSGYSHSGSASNTMPAPLYEAKVAAKAAARAAAAAALAPPPELAPVAVRPTAPARSPVLPPAAEPPSPAAQGTSDTVVIREVPKPSAPAPAPKQAPGAPTAASSSSGADSGGGHRGGVIASFTGQSDPKPLAAWSAERPDDGRSPGSVPGLPSTSPD